VSGYGPWCPDLLIRSTVSRLLICSIGFLFDKAALSGHGLCPLHLARRRKTYGFKALTSTQAIQNGFSHLVCLSSHSNSPRGSPTSTDSAPSMSPTIAVPRPSQTAFDDENVNGRGSSSTLLEIPKERAAGLRKWKSLTRMFDSKKKSNPLLRQTSLAINVRPDLHSSVILSDPGLYGVYCTDPRSLVDFISRSIPQIGSQMTSTA